MQPPLKTRSHSRASLTQSLGHRHRLPAGLEIARRPDRNHRRRCHLARICGCRFPGYPCHRHRLGFSHRNCHHRKLAHRKAYPKGQRTRFELDHAGRTRRDRSCRKRRCLHRFSRRRHLVSSQRKHHRPAHAQTSRPRIAVCPRIRSAPAPHLWRPDDRQRLRHRRRSWFANFR